MLSIGEIAKRDGVSKGAVSQKVKRLVERHGLKVERDALGRVAKVAIDEYDALRARVDDPSKAQAPRPSSGASRHLLPRAGEGVGDPESYDEALRKKTWIEFEQKRLTLEIQRRRLIDVGEMADSLDRAAGVIRSALDRREEDADDVAAAAARDGVRGVREAIKRMMAQAFSEISNALAQEAREKRAAIDDASEAPLPEEIAAGAT